MDKLKDMMAIRSKNLDDTLKLFQFFNDAANVHSWILEKLKIASSEDCGHDFEHAQVNYIASDNLFYMFSKD